MDDRLMSFSIAVGACLVFCSAYLMHRHMTREKRLQEEARAKEHVDNMVRAGVMTPDGNTACIVCGTLATEYMPISGASWMDMLPLLNRLFSLPPRYVIVDNVAGDQCLCRLHKAVAVRKLEEFHAGLRAERASFNSMHEQRVAAMDGGQMLRMVMQQHQTHLQLLHAVRRTATPVPQLESFHDVHDAFDTAIVSGAGASIPPEEETAIEAKA